MPVPRPDLVVKFDQPATVHTQFHLEILSTEGTKVKCNRFWEGGNVCAAWGGGGGGGGSGRKPPQGQSEILSGAFSCHL